MAPIALRRRLYAARTSLYAWLEIFVSFSSAFIFSTIGMIAFFADSRNGKFFSYNVRYFSPDWFLALLFGCFYWWLIGWVFYAHSLVGYIVKNILLMKYILITQNMPSPMVYSLHMAKVKRTPLVI